MTDKINFGEWLKRLMDERGMSQADLARRMNKKTGVVSSLVNNKHQQPSVDTCKLIAEVFNLPLEEVYRAADILPDTAPIDPITEKIIHLTKTLDDNERQEILDYVRYRNEKQQSRHDAGDSKRVVGYSTP